MLQEHLEAYSVGGIVQSVYMRFQFDVEFSVHERQFQRARHIAIALLLAFVIARGSQSGIQFGGNVKFGARVLLRVIHGKIISVDIVVLRAFENHTEIAVDVVFSASFQHSPEFGRGEQAYLKSAYVADVEA